MYLMISFLCILFLSFFFQISISIQEDSTEIQPNDYPIILVHGFAGWGRNELLPNIKHWGGFQGDIQEELIKNGNSRVYTASIGPFSSNWDRACELFAQIKGGRVDYGEHHSNFHQHKRYGRSYEGFYPQWGEMINGTRQKVHLIGHSMGGQTIRMLSQLLLNGTKGALIEENNDMNTSTLFEGDHGDWIESITTIATPHRGTFLADGISSLLGEDTWNLVLNFLSAAGVVGKEEQEKLFYDVKLDQWEGMDCVKKQNETLQAFLYRIFSFEVFQKSHDFSIYSLSTKGAKEELSWVKNNPNVFYFSFLTQDTYETMNFLNENIHLPNVWTMFLPFTPFSAFLGGRFGPRNGFDEIWQANDGIVNTFSMRGVENRAIYDDTTTKMKLQMTRGIEWEMMIFNKMDHVAIIGFNVHTRILKFYLHLATFLQGKSAFTTIESDAFTLESDAVVSEFREYVG